MNRTTKTFLIVGTAAILGSAAIAGAVKARDAGGPAGAGHHWSHHRHHGDVSMMEQFDLNKDGNITQAEIDQVRKDKLAKFDANKDGKLSLKEFEALWLETTRPQMVRAFQHLDANGDAVVTQEEYTKPFDHMVERRDRNNDGQINKDDVRRPGPRTVTPHDAPKGAPKADPAK